MRWYVLHVVSGKECAIAAELQRNGLQAAFPQEERLIRTGGQWIKKTYRLFPGYVFIFAEYTDAIYFKIMNIPGIIRLLRAGSRPAALEQDEVTALMLGIDPLQPSVVERTPNAPGYRIVSGILQNYEDNIIKLSWHRRRALITVNVLNEPKFFELSFELAPSYLSQTSENPAG